MSLDVVRALNPVGESLREESLTVMKLLSPVEGLSVISIPQPTHH